MLSEILDAVYRMWNPVNNMMQWGEDEIVLAQHRHPDHADTLYHCFCLLHPTFGPMSTEFVYRSHAHELLERVAAGHDTRPATAAEVVLALCEASHTAPLNTTAIGLLSRMWHTAFPDHDEFDTDREHWEKLHGTAIDDAEADTRARLAVSDRAIDSPTCTGWHAGEPVTCRYTTTSTA